MQAGESPTEHGAPSPARAVVELATLHLVAFERDDGSEPDMRLDSALELFSPEAADVISDEILPRVLANEVWSGELSYPDEDGRPQTAVTLWVPHQNGQGPPDTATILLGAAFTSHATRVAGDVLTGLPTRVVLLDRLDQARRRSRRNGDLMAALFVDLDGLKAINDRHGHEEGDMALVRAAERIRSCMRDGDTVARFGGDEFVVLCESLVEQSQARRVADRILEKLTGDPDQPLSASIGLAFDQGGQLNTLELVGRADAAMYRAKARGGGRVEVFDTEMQGRLEADASLRARLVRAISGDGLDVAAQPLFELGSGRIAGVELFIRLQEDGANLADAGNVFRLAREHSEAIDAAMLGRAIAIARSWRAELGRRSPRIHMNLSAQSLASGNFVRRVTGAFGRHRVSAQQFAFEIDTTDFVAMDDRELATLSDLQRLGTGIVIDGNEGGPASLRLINRLQPNLVKITALDTARAQPLHANVVVGLVRAVSSLGVGTCVKGIESQTMLDRVVRAGAFAGQGNVLSPVTSLAELRPRLDLRTPLGF